MLLGYYNGGVVNDNCMQQIFSWDFSFHELGVMSVVVLLLLAITLVFWTNQKDILGQEFF